MIRGEYKIKNNTIFSTCIFLFLSFAIGGCSKPSDAPNDAEKYMTEETLTKIESINDKNRHLIGKELFLDSVELITTENEIEAPEGEEEKGVTNYKIPENPIIRTLAQDDIFPGTSIQVIEIDGNITPELIGPNGSRNLRKSRNYEAFRCGWDVRRRDSASGRSQSSLEKTGEPYMMHILRVER